MKKISNRIEEHMTEYPSIASTKTSVRDASDFMTEAGVRHLPVLEDQKIVGIVSERDLRQAKLYADSMRLTVGEVMVRDPYCVPVGTPLSTVAREMAQKKYGSTIVLNREGDIVGIFTTTDAMRLLCEILDSDRGSDLRQWAVERLMVAGPFFEQASEAGL